MLAPLRFSKIMATLRATYDRIIIDSPPLLPVTDAAVLSTHADCIVYVAKFDSTGTKQIKAGLQKLPSHHAPVAGVVLNQVDIRKAESYGDHSYAGYYEYTEADAKKERRARHATAASL